MGRAIFMLGKIMLGFFFFFCAHRKESKQMNCESRLMRTLNTLLRYASLVARYSSTFPWNTLKSSSLLCSSIKITSVQTILIYANLSHIILYLGIYFLFDVSSLTKRCDILQRYHMTPSHFFLSFEPLTVLVTCL